mgnify:CR=1 FL=1
MFVLTYIDSQESTPLVISRIVLHDFAVKLEADKESDENTKNTLIDILSYAIEKLQPRVVVFEEQLTLIREHLAQIYKWNDCYQDAAQTLAGIPLESGQK